MQSRAAFIYSSVTVPGRDREATDVDRMSLNAAQPAADDRRAPSAGAPAIAFQDVTKRFPTGDGSTLEVLADVGDYFWLSASADYWHSDRFFNSGKWHLYQNRVDLVRHYDNAVPCPIDTNLANPQICSQLTGLRLCGMAELPRCPSLNGSSASRTSVRCRCRISSAIRSSIAPICASALRYCEWRSR